MIPGLENAEFVRFGVMHRNTFLESPKLLLPTLQFINNHNLLAAGQITGTEGYAAAAAGGLVAGLNAAFLYNSQDTITFPPETMIGALLNFISNNNNFFVSKKTYKFQPMPASFGIIPELSNRIKDKKLRYQAYKNRSLLKTKELERRIDLKLKNLYFNY